MSSARKAIRAHVVGLLAGKTSAGARVFANRAAPIASGTELPAIVVWTDREEAREQQAAPLVWRRALEVRIEAVARASGHPAVAPAGGTAVSLADVLDDLCEEIEAVMFRQPRFWGLDEIQGLEFRGVELDMREDTSALLGSCTLTWSVEYDTADGPDPAELPTIAKVHVDYDLPNGEDVDATDDIDLEDG